jgi:prephenate dehydrogenase
LSLNRITVIGLGLMGGSLALALRHAGTTAHIVGCDHADVLRKALEMGVIDSGFSEAGEAVEESDFVFLCVPVETSIALLAKIAPRLQDWALVSDVGSTKKEFAAAAREIFGEAAVERVLPGHPLAGREVSGLDHASADLFKGCVWVLTPLVGESLPASHAELRVALEAIGAHVTLSSPEEHDRTVAFTSHLPQMLSSALALTLEHAFGTGNPALQVHAGGLRTMLRLAESDPAMWEQIAASNHENIAVALESLEAELRILRESLGSPEFRKKFEEAREFAKTLKS